MRYARAVDANHEEIRTLLRQLPGVRVMDTSRLGGGHPDLLVRVRGTLLYIEVKDGTLPPSGRTLSPMEESFRAFVGENYYVVTSKAEALSLVLGVLE